MTGSDHITVRLATPEDAEAACKVLIASITRLCTADHKNDPATINAWTANKTPANIHHWIEDDRTRIVVAERDEQIAGVAGYSMAGEVTLNYVSPDFRFQGISGAMLDRIEQDLREAGITAARLASTVTATRFYLARGWRLDGPIEYVHGMPDQPMAKDLTAV